MSGVSELRERTKTERDAAFIQCNAGIYYIDDKQEKVHQAITGKWQFQPKQLVKATNIYCQRFARGHGLVVRAVACKARGSGFDSSSIPNRFSPRA